MQTIMINGERRIKPQGGLEERVLWGLIDREVQAMADPAYTTVDTRRDWERGCLLVQTTPKTDNPVGDLLADRTKTIWTEWYAVDADGPLMVRSSIVKYLGDEEPKYESFGESGMAP